MFQIQPTDQQFVKLSKEMILSKVSQETLLSHYLQVPVKKGLFCCPKVIRNDKQPTCAFYKNSKGDIIFKDFRPGSVNGNFITIVMHIYQCDYVKALKIIANDFGIVTNPRLEKHPPIKTYQNEEIEEISKSIIQVEIKEFSKEELEWWGKHGVNKLQLDKFKVYSVKSVFLNGTYFCSSNEKSFAFGYYGGKDSSGLELWRIYFPQRRSFRFLSNWSSSMLQGGKQLPKHSDHCIIGKSLKDVMTLHNGNITAISPCSETVLISNNVYNKLKTKFSNLLYFSDNDLAGVKSAHKYKKEYPELRCIFLKRKYAKDISDFHKKYGAIRFIEACEEINNILKDKTIRSSKYFYVF